VNVTLSIVDGRAVLRMERRLGHPPEKVWRALTEPAHLNQWYPFQVTALELRAGGRIAFDGGDGAIVEGVVTELDPPRVLAFTQDASAVLEREGDNHLRFELRPDGDGCLLVFTHTFDDRPHAAANAAGWDVCFDALELVADGKPVEMPAGFVERHEAYVEAFGLDQGSAETTPDGWRVRFERQLMQQPVDKVWAALDAAGAEVGGPPPPASTTAEVRPGRSPRSRRRACSSTSGGRRTGPPAGSAGSWSRRPPAPASSSPRPGRATWPTSGRSPWRHGRRT
jgi:uncharacterized protein YndB with AHSA1/START domain